MTAYRKGTDQEMIKEKNDDAGLRHEGRGMSSSGSRGVAEALAVGRRLPFNMQHQQQSNWCWAAAAASVAEYYAAGTPVYNLGLSDLTSPTALGSAQLTGWRYLLRQNDQIVASAATLTSETGAEQFSAFNHGPFVASTAAALETAENLPATKNRAYELRLLHVPALHTMALWLHDPASNDLLIPLAPSPKDITATRALPKGTHVGEAGSRGSRGGPRWPSTASAPCRRGATATTQHVRTSIVKAPIPEQGPPEAGLVSERWWSRTRSTGGVRGSRRKPVEQYGGQAMMDVRLLAAASSTFEQASQRVRKGAIAVTNDHRQRQNHAKRSDKH